MIRVRKKDIGETATDLMQSEDGCMTGSNGMTKEVWETSGISPGPAWLLWSQSHPFGPRLCLELRARLYEEKQLSVAIIR